MPFRDLTFAGRTLSRSPVFTIATALTIALAIGAATAIFSVMNAVLLRPLPYKDPDRLVVMYGDLRARANFGMPFSNENFTDIRSGTTRSFEDFAAVFTGRQVLHRPDGTPEQVRFALVTPNFFSLMGARIVVGRDFEEADGQPQPQDGTPETQTAALPTMVILSYEYWQRRYGGNTDVLGQQVFGPGPQAQQIVGVLGPAFEILFPPTDNVETSPDIWIANRLTYDNANRNAYGLRPIGRLKRGVTLAQAQDEVESVTTHIRENFSLYATSRFYARLEPMHKTLVADVRPAILALMAAVIFLVLIACANVANLLLVRTSLRETELSVRAALGAGWWGLLQQMLAEAVLLAALGTVGGVALAWLGIHELRLIAPANLPRLESIGIDLFVLAFSALIGLAAAVFFGTAPAWGGFRLNVTDALRGSSRTAGPGGRSVMRNLLIVAEVALCFVLLIGSGLMYRSFLELQRIDPGFDPDGLLTFQLLGGRDETPEQRAAFTRRIEERLASIPGVQRVTAATPFPLAGGFTTIRWGTEEALSDNTKYQAVDWQSVLPGYFETIGTPLIDGRAFTEADNDPARNVVVVDQVLAAKAFPNESAIGKRILIRIRTPEPEWVEIIGVVGHQRVTSLSDPGREQVYFTDGFLGFGSAGRWALRTSGRPTPYAEAVRGEITRLDPQLLVADLQPMNALVQRAQASTRFSLLLISVFAVVAALLVSVGLYGVLSTVVRHRTGEIGLRMALGAAPAAILRLVVGQGLRLSAAGLVVGLIAAFGLTRLMTSMLVGVTPTDPMTFAGVAMVFLLIVAISSWLPARRAAALDPTAALREK